MYVHLFSQHVFGLAHNNLLCVWLGTETFELLIKLVTICCQQVGFLVCLNQACPRNFALSKLAFCLHFGKMFLEIIFIYLSIYFFLLRLPKTYLVFLYFYYPQLGCKRAVTQCKLSFNSTFSLATKSFSFVHLKWEIS